MKLKRSTGRSGDPTPNATIGYSIVVIGTSWGGLAALRTIVSALPSEYAIPVAIVQHRHRDSDAMLARYLQDHTPLRVCEVEDKEPLAAGRVFIAPANYHLLVERGHFALSVDAPVRYSRPSIDVAMLSAATSYGHQAVGVVLTGANADGAEGLRQITAAGGLAVIQDPSSAEMPIMPLAALTAAPKARIFPLERLPLFLAELPGQPSAARA